MLVLTLITEAAASCCCGAAVELSVASGCTIALLLEAGFPMLGLHTAFRELALY
jgi:hypothetical protein